MTLTRRHFLAGLGAVLTLPALPAGARELLQIEGPAFGAGFRLRAAAGGDAGAMARAITRVIASVDAAMSPWRDTSAITRFNRADTTDWLPLPPDALATIAEAQRVAMLSGGAFDPTVGGLVGRFGFGPMPEAPSGAFAELALGEGMARKAHARQTLDLCGIAKGQALDLCAGALAAAGVGAYCLEIGGEVLARGLNPMGQPWRVGVENPLPGTTAPRVVLRLDGAALATSGDRVNGYDIAGQRISHIIDPARARPVGGALASVSVLADRAVTADALATALFALGAERGPELARAQDISALFMARAGDGLRVETTGGFDASIVEG